MRQFFPSLRREVWLGLLLVTLFIAPALSPLWGLDLPQSYDGLHRLHRLIEFDQAVRHGVLFPRWAPDFVFGYGYPVFNYFPYAHYYLPELLHLLGLPFAQALAAAFSLYTLLAGYGTFLLCRDLFGDAPALLAAVVYVYAPYQLYNSLVRGNLPEQFGLALFPLVLWAFRRLAIRGERRSFAASALLYAVFLLSHTALGLMLTPVLALTLAAHKPARVREPVMALALGGGLSAFVLLPAFFEKEWVRLGERLLVLVDFHTAFLSPAQLLALPPTAIACLLHRPDYFGLGVVSLALALPAVLIGWKRLSKDFRPWLVTTVGLLLLSVYLTLPISLWLWEHLPLLPFLFFPWRFLSIAGLALSLLAGMTLSLLPPKNWRLVVLAAGLTLVVLASLPLLYPHYYPPRLVSQDVADALAFEARTGLLGASSYAEYLPIWVQETPADSPLLSAYQADQPRETIERFDATSLPAGGRVVEARYGFNRAEITVSSPQPFQARFHTFYFPGWKATVNGERADLAPVGSLGLMGLPLPAGESRVRLWFGDTPWRTAGKAISLASGGLLLALALKRDLWMLRRSETSTAGWSACHAMGLAALALGLLAFKLVYVDGHDSPFRVQVEGAEHALDISFGDQLTLLGYDLSTPTLHANGEASLTLYWRQQQRLTDRPRVALTLINPATGVVLPQAAGWVPQDYPLELWELDWYTRDFHRLVAAVDAPPGRYLLTLGLFDEASGEAIGETVTLTALKVPLPPQDVRPEHPLDLTLGEEIALIGYDLTLGDPLGLTLYWRCLGTPGDDYTVFVHALDAAGDIVAQADSQPQSGAYPTSIWVPGEVVPDEFALPMTDLPGGDYRLAVGLYRLATAERLPMTDARGQRLPDDRLLLPVRRP